MLKLKTLEGSDHETMHLSQQEKIWKGTKTNHVSLRLLYLSGCGRVGDLTAHPMVPPHFQNVTHLLTNSSFFQNLEIFLNKKVHYVPLLLLCRSMFE